MNGEKEPAIKLSREINYGAILQAFVVFLAVGVPLSGFLLADHSAIVGLTERVAAVERGQAETHAQFQRIAEETRSQFQRISDAREHDAAEQRAAIAKVQEIIVDGQLKAANRK
jgi:hypothetical protein